MKLVHEAQLMVARKYHIGEVATIEALTLIKAMMEEYNKSTKKEDKFYLLFECSELAFAFHNELHLIVKTMIEWYKLLLQKYSKYMRVLEQKLCVTRMQELSRFHESPGEPMLVQMQLHSDSMQTVLPIDNDEQCLQIQQRLSALTF